MRKILYNLPICMFMLVTTGCAMLQKNPPSPEEKRKISENFSAQSRIAIAECFHARAIVGDSVWAGWSKSIIPVNVVTQKYEYLINYPNPPSKYTFLEHDNLLQTDIYFKKRTFKQLLIGSALPFNGKLTAFFSPIEQFKEKFPFVDMNFYRILLMHEMFHIYQLEHNSAALSAISKLHTYPYKTEPNNQMRAEEAAILKKAILADSRENVVKQVSLFLQARQSRRERMRMEFPKLYGDREVTREKWREWVEGLARYTEVKISDELATPSYKSLPEFTELQNSADSTFDREMKKLDKVSLNSGEESDYALGWAQWYILDKLRPDWKNEVFGENAFPEDLLKKSI